MVQPHAGCHAIRSSSLSATKAGRRVQRRRRSRLGVAAVAQRGLAGRLAAPFVPLSPPTRCPGADPAASPPPLPPSSVLPGFLKFVVSNVKDLELLLMHNRKYCAEIAHNVSTLKRKAIAERAAEVRSSFSQQLGRAAARPGGQYDAAVVAGLNLHCTCNTLWPERSRCRLLKTTSACLPCALQLTATHCRCPPPCPSSLPAAEHCPDQRQQPAAQPGGRVSCSPPCGTSSGATTLGA